MFEKIKKALSTIDAGAKGGTRAQRLARFAVKASAGSTYYLVRHISKSKKKGLEAVFDGTKNMVAETFLEDAPVTADIYHAGISEGERKGFTRATKIMAPKFRDLGREIIAIKSEHKALVGRIRDEYDSVIREYDKECCRLLEQTTRTEAENAYLKELQAERERMTL